MSTRESLLEAVAKHCAPLVSSRPGGKEDVGQGTVTFVEYAGRCLGITNRHVVFPGDQGPRELSLALGALMPLPGRLWMTSSRDSPDLPLDISVFLLHREALQRGGKTPYPLGPEIRPPEMQPMEEGERALAVGYPGSFPQAGGRPHCVIGTCVGVSDRRIILHNTAPEQPCDIAFSSPLGGPLGGMSGGPIFSLHAGGRYGLAGIIYQGRGSADTEHADIWIYGFPLNRKLMEKVQDLAEG